MSLSIIIPCKNEEQTIIKTITKINKIIKKDKEYEYFLLMILVMTIPMKK